MPLDPLTSSIHTRIAALVRDLGADELSIRSMSRVEIPVAVTVRHEAELDTVTSRNAGPLPGNAMEVGSTSELRGALDARFQDAAEHVGPRLDAWVSAQGRDYRARPAPADCMAELAALGTEEVCGGCEGEGEVPCGRCDGDGWTTCPACDGSGRVRCGVCGGSARERCSTCGGSGTRTETSYPARFDGQKWVNDQVIATVTCHGCGGRGEVACGCGDGWQRCSGCDAGRVTCGNCQGTGRVECEPCDATGALHTLGWVECSVGREVELEVESADARDRDTLTDRVPFDELGRLAARDPGVRLERVLREGHAVTLYYRASVPLDVAEAEFGVRAALLRAYGPGLEIFDWENLMGGLLEPDLAALETCLQARRGGRRGRALLDATRRFFESELNDRIAEAPPAALRALASSQPDSGQGAAVAAAADVAPEDYAGNVVVNALTLAPYRRLFHRSSFLLRLPLLLFGLAYLFVVISLSMTGNPSGGVFLYLVLAALGLPFVLRARRANLLREARDTGDTGSGERDAAASAQIVLTEAVALGMITPAYLARATAAVEKALPRLYQPLVMPALLVTTGTAGLALVGAALLRPEWPLRYMIVGVLAVAVAVWVLVEGRANASFRAMFGTQLHARLSAPLARAKNRFRAMLAGGLALAAYAAWWSGT
jgi:hypothetical protein